MRFRNPGAAYDSSFGLYNIDGSGNVTNQLLVFDKNAQGGDPSGDFQSVWFKNTGSGWQASLDAANWVTFDNVFGFYSDVYVGSDNSIDWTFYTDASLNTDGNEHFAIAFKDPNSAFIFFEDRMGYGIWNTSDQYDYMVGSTDITPVPEPTTMLFFGAGLLGLAGVARRKSSR